MSKHFKKHLTKLVLEEHSREQAERQSDEIGADPGKFAVAWELFCKGVPPIPQRLSYFLTIHWERHPEILREYIGKIIERLPLLKHDAEKRVVVRSLATIKMAIPEEELGLLIEKAYEWLLSANVAIAIRVHSMQLLYNISIQIPELKRELLITITEMLPEAGAAIRSRGTRLAKKLSKETGEHFSLS